MAIPVYQEFAEGKLAGNGSVDVDVSGFTLSAGDLLIGILVSDGKNETHTSPDGDTWNDILVSITEGTNVTASVWWKTAVGNEATLTFGCGSTEALYAVVLRITGHNASTPIDSNSASATGDDTSAECPDILTQEDNQLILRIFGADHHDVTIDGGWASVANISVDESDTGNGACSGGVGQEDLASQGQTGTEINTLTAVEEWVAFTIGIREVSGAQNYTRNSAVLIGNLVTASRELAIDRDSSVLVGVLTTASKIWNSIQPSSVLIGNLVSASRVFAIDKDSSVLIGNYVSALRRFAIDRDSSILIGNFVSATRVRGLTQASSVIIGIVTTATRALAATRTSSVLVGIVATASKAVSSIRQAATQIGVLVSASYEHFARVPENYVRLASVRVGVAVPASRAIAIERTAQVVAGVVVTAVNLVSVARAASVIVGEVISATKSRNRTVSSSVLVGLVVTASRIAAYFRPPYYERVIVVVGVAVTASRTISVSMASSVVVGIVVSASKVYGRSRDSSVLVGIVTTASYVRNVARNALVEIGVAVSASRLLAIIRHNSSSVGIVVTASWGHARNLIIRAITSQYRKIKGDVS